MYLDESELPKSREQVLTAVIDRVHGWYQSKFERFSPPIPWEKKMQLLAALAYSAFRGGKSYALDQETVENTLLIILKKWEERRQIQPGLTIRDILDRLAATGFIFPQNEEITFWHRAFLEYFAAQKVAQDVKAGNVLLDDVISHPEWEAILPLAASKAAKPENFVEALLKHNIFTAARALLECNLTDGETYRRVVDVLVDKCMSPTRPIREMAVSLLQQIKGDYVGIKFRKLFEDDELLNCRYEHIRKIALAEIAKRKIPNAREIIYANLDWHSYTSQERLEDGPADTAVIEALGEFDDKESHLHIISTWRESPVIYIHDSSRDALIKVAKRVKVANVVIETLLDFFLPTEEYSPPSYQLAEVLIALDDIRVIPKLISALRQFESNKDQFQASCIVDVLASFTEPEVVNQLIENANDGELNKHARSRFAEALSKVQAEIPFDIFAKLAGPNECDEVRCHGIRGLGRFPFDKTKELVLPAIYPPSYEEALESHFSFADVQAAAFEVLAKHRQLEILLEVDKQPDHFYTNSLEVLFDAISRDQLYSMSPYIESMINKKRERGYNTSNRPIVQAAWVLADLGQVERAQEIIEELINELRLRKFGSQSDWVFHDILRGIHRLPASYALEIVDNALTQILSGDEDGPYEMDLCIGALERIGTPEACEVLAQLAEDSTTVYEHSILTTERAIRAIEFIGPKDREDWLLEFLEKHSNTNALNRIIDTLGLLGGRQSLPVLQNYFESSSSERTRTFCFWAIHNIYKRSDELWFNGEEKIQ